MIEWAEVSVPYYAPTSGAVFLYMLVGLFTLIYIAVMPKSGYRILTVRDSPITGIVWTLIIVCIWPMGWVILIRASVRRRRHL